MRGRCSHSAYSVSFEGMLQVSFALRALITRTGVQKDSQHLENAYLRKHHTRSYRRERLQRDENPRSLGGCGCLYLGMSLDQATFGSLLAHRPLHVSLQTHLTTRSKSGIGQIIRALGSRGVVWNFVSNIHGIYHSQDFIFGVTPFLHFSI